jgi:alkylresorcinol/alkylpyrone synthase
VSSTGLATPGVDARIATTLGFRPDVRRTPIWGLGCAGGAAGLSRARAFALADPGCHVLLIALELCSLTFQRNERSKRNLVAASLFADGAAAAVVTCEPEHRNGTAPLELAAAGSTLWPETLDVMGWEVDGDGLHVVFSRDIPTFIRERVRSSLDTFLEASGLDRTALDHVVAHPGGPKVITAYEETLGLPPDTLRHAREVLRDCGNMSSPTCLFVLERFMEGGDIAPGDIAVLTALGPGFGAEYVLLRGLPG